MAKPSNVLFKINLNCRSRAENYCHRLSRPVCVVLLSFGLFIPSPSLIVESVVFGVRTEPTGGINDNPSGTHFKAY